MENKLIGLLLTRTKSIARVLDLQPDMFENRKFGEVFKFIKDSFVNEGISVDALLLRKATSLSPVEIADLMNTDGANIANIGIYAASIKESWLKREFRKICAEAVHSINEKDVFENISGIQESTAKLLTSLTSGHTKSVGDDVDTYSEYFFRQDLLVETGIPQLDDLLTVRMGDLCIVAARPAMGKTGYAISVANRLTDTHVLFFSLEMGSVS